MKCKPSILYSIERVEMKKDDWKQASAFFGHITAK